MINIILEPENLNIIKNLILLSTRDMKYIFFERNDESDMEFDDPGFYRVFLLDEDGKTVASALVEIID